MKSSLCQGKLLRLGGVNYVQSCQALGCVAMLNDLPCNLGQLKIIGHSVPFTCDCLHLQSIMMTAWQMMPLCKMSA